MTRFRKQFAMPLVSLVLLAGIFVDVAMYHRVAADVGPYQQSVRDAVAHLPYHVGDWIATDVEVPPAAEKLLRPNIIVSRRYQNTRTHETVNLLLVQCSDARDLQGHYPPICYPAHGWVEQDSRRRDWKVDGLTIHGTEYRFIAHSVDQYQRIIIDDFMILPDGQTAASMAKVVRIAKDRQKRVFGAAQMQVVFGVDMPATRRDQIFHQMVRAAMPVIQAIRSGVPQ